MKTENYTQCKLEKQYDNTCRAYSYVVWIPSKFAKIGKMLTVKQDDESWSDGWKVVATYTTQKAAQVEEDARDYLHQRKASDI